MEIGQTGQEFSFSVGVLDVVDLHSIRFDLILPETLSVDEANCDVGAFWTLRGGSPIKFVQKQDDGSHRITLALLGTDHDVSGDGVIFTSVLESKGFPQGVQEISVSNWILRNTNGDEISVSDVAPALVQSGREPRLTLESTITKVRETDEELTVSLTGHDLVELHSYALEIPYNSTALQFQSVDEGGFHGSGGGETVFLSQDKGNSIHLASSLLGTDHDVSGDGTLATLRFRAESLSELPTTIQISGLVMKDTLRVDWAPVVIAESLTFLTESEDGDSDGLLDSWEVQHFGTPSDVRALPNLDPDGDGHTNLFEYLAGLNPLDPDSRFIIKQDSTQPEEGHWIGYGPIQESRSYVVEWSDLRAPVSWITLQDSDRRSQDGMEWQIDESGDSKKFYRVRILLNN